MAIAGIQILNTFGTIMIDENYKNLAVRQSGSVSKTGRSTTELVPITYPIDAPIVAISPAQFAYVSSLLPSGQSFRYGGGISRPTSIDYYVFDTPVIQPGNFGLQVYNALGQLTFDSGMKYARVVDIFGGSTEASWAGTRTYEAGRKYSVAQLASGLIRESERVGSTYTNTWRRSMARIVGNVLTTSLVLANRREGDASPVTPVNETGATFAVIDVTGY